MTSGIHLPRNFFRGHLKDAHCLVPQLRVILSRNCRCHVTLLPLSYLGSSRWGRFMQRNCKWTNFDLRHICDVRYKGVRLFISAGIVHDHFRKYVRRNVFSNPLFLYVLRGPTSLTSAVIYSKHKSLQLN
jgi:hypothetical protein